MNRMRFVKGSRQYNQQKEERLYRQMMFEYKWYRALRLIALIILLVVSGMFLIFWAAESSGWIGNDYG